MKSRIGRLAVPLIIVGTLLFSASVLQAQESDATHDAETADEHAVAATGGSLFGDTGLAKIGAGIGAGLVLMGGAAGIGRIGGSAVESMARQPEAAGSINMAMIITAAMIEGATLFGVIVCLLAIVL
jgi:F-type H+-transporting ATPase subunit c